VIDRTFCAIKHKSLLHCAMHSVRVIDHNMNCDRSQYRCAPLGARAHPQTHFLTHEYNRSHFIVRSSALGKEGHVTYNRSLFPHFPLTSPYAVYSSTPLTTLSQLHLHSPHSYPPPTTTHSRSSATTPLPTAGHQLSPTLAHFLYSPFSPFLHILSITLHFLKDFSAFNNYNLYTLTTTICVYRLQLSSMLDFYCFAGGWAILEVVLHHLGWELCTTYSTKVLTNT
jgi:hypothetical protein